MTRLTTVKRSIGRYGAALGLIIGASLVGGASMAQAAGASPQFPTAFSVNYFNNPGTAGMDEIYIQNETNNGNSIPGATYCALIYAFYPDQEMVGCCGVAITPNESFTNSISQLLIGIDKAGPLPVKGTLKVVATTNSGTSDDGGVLIDSDDCDPSGDFVTQTAAPHALQAWITHTTAYSPAAPGTFMTEEPFAQTGEPTSDLSALEAQCQTVTGGGVPIVCPGSL